MSAAAFVRLRPEDRLQAQELMLAYYAEDGHEYRADVADAALEAILAGTAPAWFWLIECDGAVAGYVCVTGGFSLEVGAGDFFLDEIYIVPQARGRGLGQAAIAFAESEAKARGARRLCLEVQPDNTRAADLYRRCGYESHGRPLLSKLL